MSGDDSGNPRGVVLARNDIFLVVIPGEFSRNPKHFGFEVQSMGEFEQYAQVLIEAGFTIRPMPMSGSPGDFGEHCFQGKLFKTFYFNDPNGILLEIQCCLV